MSPADRGIAAALLDDDRRWHDGRRVALTEPTKRSAPSALLATVFSALRAIHRDANAHEDAEGRVWIDESLYIEADADCFYVMRDTAVPGFGHTDQCGPGFVRERGEAWAMRQAASALVREWVREQLDAWVSDDGKGE